MLIAQTDAGIAVLAEGAAVLGEGGDVVFRNVGIGVGDGCLVYPIGVVAMGEGHLRARLQRALPEGMGQHELRGVETAVGTGLAADEIVGHTALLNVLAVGIGAARHVVEIEVDAQPSHLAVVIGVGEQAEGLGLVAGLMGVEMVDEGIVLEHILVVDDLVLAAEEVRQVGTDTHGVVVRQLTVHACRIGQLVVLPCHRVGALLQEGLFRGHSLVPERTVLAMILMEII